MKHTRVLSLALCVAAMAQTGFAYWQVIHPFNPATQDTAITTVAGRHNRAGATNAVEAYAGSLYYCVYGDGSAHPAKVYRHNAQTGENTLILSASADAFIALGAMRGHLYISHTDGRLFRTSGGAAEFLTRYPFTAASHVTTMAEFNNTMYFGTSRGEIYRSANGTVFQLVAAMSGSVQDLVAWQGALYGCDSSGGGGTSMLFRSLNGTD